jgi:hypothetical protein
MHKGVGMMTVDGLFKFRLIEGLPTFGRFNARSRPAV